MQKHDKQISELLYTAGAHLIRKNSHQVYRFPNGRNFVTAATPSDRRASRNSLADLRRILEAQSAAVEEAAPQIDISPDDEQPKPRVRIPNRAPHEAIDMSVVSFHDGPSVARDANPSKSPIAFESIYDVLDTVYEVPSFWELDTCGRLRVLTKFASQFATVDVLPYRYCTGIPDEVGRGMAPEVLADVHLRLESMWHRRRAP